MKIYGIVAEYNPFHNGHKYLTQQAKRLGATHIIAVMSGNFVQRGELAAADKFIRAKMAVECGVDLIIELPVPYSLSTADFFAKGAVSLMNELGSVDGIIFGAETADINLLESISLMEEDISLLDKLKELMKKGESYPKAFQTVVTEKHGAKVGSILASPNNLLAVEYLKALRFYSSAINPYVVGRKSVMHDSHEICNEYASASLIRHFVDQGKDIGKLVPLYVSKTIKYLGSSGKISNTKELESIILYTVRNMTREQFEALPDMTYELAGRFVTAAHNSASYEEFITIADSKRFTMAHIRRLVMSAVIGIPLGLNRKKAPYARILAFNEKGCEILKETAKTSRIPVSTSLSDLSKTSEKAGIFAQLEAHSTDIYNLSLLDKKCVGEDFTRMITKQ